MAKAYSHDAAQPKAQGLPKGGPVTEAAPSWPAAATTGGAAYSMPTNQQAPGLPGDQPDNRPEPS